jgi:Uma2 family endonuclease
LGAVSDGARAPFVSSASPVAMRGTGGGGILRRMELPGGPDSHWTSPFEWTQWYLEDDYVSESNEQERISREVRSQLAGLATERGWGRFHVGSNQYFAWLPDRPQVRIAPDVYLVDVKRSGRREEPRSWQTWRPGHLPPRWAMEIVSSGNWEKDYKYSPGRYDQLGCSELIVFDPAMVAPDRPVSFEQRAALAVYRRVEAGRFERVYWGPGPAWSRELQVWLLARYEGYQARVLLSYDERGEQLVPTEVEVARRAEAERATRARAGERAQTKRAEKAEARARAQKQRAEKAEIAARIQKQKADEVQAEERKAKAAARGLKRKADEAQAEERKAKAAARALKQKADEAQAEERKAKAAARALKQKADEAQAEERKAKAAARSLKKRADEAQAEERKAKATARALKQKADEAQARERKAKAAERAQRRRAETLELEKQREEARRQHLLEQLHRAGLSPDEGEEPS